jgi:hypothetical protein
MTDDMSLKKVFSHRGEAPVIPAERAAQEPAQSGMQKLCMPV